MRPMRRAERQVADEAGIRAILDRCQVCRLALWDEEGPYIVPLSYGYRWEDGGLKLYFHCAREGRKLDALRRNPRAAFEMDTGYTVVEAESACGYTCTYQSVTGMGTLAGGGKPAGGVRGPELPDASSDGQGVCLCARQARRCMRALSGGGACVRQVQRPGIMPGRQTVK